MFCHERFAFDPAGNRLDGLSGSHTEKETTLNRVWGNLLKNWLGKHYEYDQRGNLLAKSENGKQETFRQWHHHFIPLGRRGIGGGKQRQQHHALYF